MTIEIVISVPQESLHLAGHTTDHIWAMGHGDDCIGLRVDCGDAGTLYMTKYQAREIIDTLQSILAELATLAPSVPEATK